MRFICNFSCGAAAAGAPRVRENLMDLLTVLAYVLWAAGALLWTALVLAVLSPLFLALRLVRAVVRGLRDK